MGNIHGPAFTPQCEGNIPSGGDNTAKEETVGHFNQDDISQCSEAYIAILGGCSSKALLVLVDCVHLLFQSVRAVRSVH